MGFAGLGESGRSEETAVEFVDVVMKRRAVRRFQEGGVPRETIERIAQLAQRAPSGGFSQGQRLGGFVGATYATGPVAFSADLVYLNVRNKQDYGPNNTPQIATWGTDLLSLSLGASYRVLPQLTLSAGLGLNRIMKQTVAPADTANDINWASLQLGATYAVTQNLDVKLSGVTWLNNNKFDYSRVALGLTYKF